MADNQVSYAVDVAIELGGCYRRTSLLIEGCVGRRVTRGRRYAAEKPRKEPKMSRQRVPLFFVLMVVTFFLVGCGGSAPTAVVEAPAATSAPEQAATSTPEPLPDTPTPTPEPPTATPAPPELTDGTNIWRLKSYDTTRIVFECVTQQSPPWPVRAGGGPEYTKLYVTDSEGKRYQAIQIGLSMLGTSAQECTTFEIVFKALPEDRQGLQLHFADLPPIDLGQ